MSDLLASVLTWCADHPPERAVPGPDEYGEMWVEKRVGRRPAVKGDAPTILAVAADLLIEADPQVLSFADGILTMDLDPEPLRYRAIGPAPDSYVVVFEREAS